MVITFAVHTPYFALFFTGVYFAALVAMFFFVACPIAAGVAQPLTLRAPEWGWPKHAHIETYARHFHFPRHR